MAIEAVVALINYGCTQKEIRFLLGNDPTITKFGHAYDSMLNGIHALALEEFSSFNASNSNSHALLYIGQTHHKSGDLISAGHVFSKLRRLEPFWIDGMDQYAMILENVWIEIDFRMDPSVYSLD